ncbi:glycerophosphodiester phosphodiesterase [Isoalcanivorax pacificus]|nr:glycerophosphodiester phosphodiesterase [Isoalcanivorax pacificus]
MTIPMPSVTSAVPAMVGHRGARGEAPENTLAGFLLAVEAGVKAIELDVRMSADGQLIVLHDSHVDRTTWHSGKARQFTQSELGLLDARRNTPGWHSPVGIPTLAEVVDHCPDWMGFQFEVKGGDDRRYQNRLAHNLRRLIHERGMHDRVVVTSSDTGFLRMMGTQAPDVMRGYVCEYRYLQPTRRTAALGCRWLIAHYSLVTPRLMERARRRGLHVSVWTVNDLNEAERLASLGVDSIITDFPTSFMAHFSSREARRARQ